MRGWFHNAKQRVINVLLIVLEAVVGWLYTQYDWREESWYDNEEYEWESRLADLKDELVRLKLEEADILESPDYRFGDIRRLNDAMEDIVKRIRSTEICLELVRDEMAFQYSVANQY